MRGQSRSLTQTAASRISNIQLDNISDIYKTPDQDLTRLRFENLKNLSLSNNPKNNNNLDIRILFNNGIKILKIADSGFKRALRDSQKESSTDKLPGQILNKRLNISKKPITRMDHSLLRTINRNQPLTKKQFAQLQRLEVAGFISINDLDNKRDIVEALYKHTGKLSISKYDCNIIKAIEQGDSIKVKTSANRIEGLIEEGYISRSNANLFVNEKFYSVRDELILRGLLDPREKKLVADERIRRLLPEDQIEVIKNLKQFSNLTEGQLFDIYKQNGQEVYFKQDLRNMQKRGFLEKQQNLGVTRKDFQKIIQDKNKSQALLDEFKEKGYISKKGILTNKCNKDNKLKLPDEYKQYQTEIEKVLGSKKLSFNLYNLKPHGNKIGDILLQNRNKSKSYTKNSKELLHDLLQYEAAKLVTKEIESNGGKVTDIVIDRNKRSEIYTQNFQNIGQQNKQSIMDLEIRYQDKNNRNQREFVEIDRGYDARVIRDKSTSFSKPVKWFTDSTRQAKRIAKHAKSSDNVYLIKGIN